MHRQSDPAEPPDVLRRFLLGLGACGYRGDVESSESSRLAMATDNSIYQQMPAAVLYPRDTADVQHILQMANQPEFSGLSFTPRGGGTGTNGQSLTSGVVIDFSRHMNSIIELDAENGRVFVQPGVVKDALNDFLRPHGLFFSPDLSTSNRAVIGGMISTDASGQGSLRYGKTSDRVLGLSCVLADGELLETAPMTLDEAALKASGNGIESRVIEQLLITHAQYPEEISQHFPDLNRFLTGYDLKHALRNERVDLSRLICGAEGTLAVITGAWLDLDPIPDSRILVNINYDSFDAALRAAPVLLQADALSVETVDSTVLRLARADVVWNDVAGEIDDAANPAILGLNLVEFAGNDGDLEEARTQALCASLDVLIKQPDSGVLGYRVCRDLAGIQRVYSMRKKAVGLLAKLEGDARPVAFVEDTCVPPEHLADYIGEFRALLDRRGLKYGMFGHVDCGVLHVRPALDLTDPPQRKLVRAISDEVAALTEKYGGLFWGEHGRGYRSEYGAVFFGDTLYAELRRIKAAFDPQNRLNPGKICTPWTADGASHGLVSVDGPMRGELEAKISPTVRASYPGPMACNGNGLCFNYDTSSVMCPSWKATADRRHTPKGRAALLREWLRRQAVDTLESGFEDEVAEALRGCLACKACSTACPVSVDIPTWRSQFLQQYHQRRRRPVKDYLVAGVEYYGPWLAKWPALGNLLSLNPASRALMPRLIGMTDLPALSARSVLRDLTVVPDLNKLEAISSAEKKGSVCLVADAFTLFYDAPVIAELARLVESLGQRPLLLPFIPNGKPMHVKGFLKTFEKVAMAGSAALNRVARLGIPMVGVDPAMTLCYRDEYRQVLGKRRGDFEVLLPQEWLLQQVVPDTGTDVGREYTLLAHCTERSLVAESVGQWQRVFERFGLTLHAPAAGCCGMCGSYGHETEFLGHSRTIFDLDWAGKLETSGTEVLATGYSCRSQVKRFAGKALRHPLQVLLMHLDSSVSA